MTETQRHRTVEPRQYGAPGAPLCTCGAYACEEPNIPTITPDEEESW